MEIKMTKQTLLLAAAAVLSLGVGSAFADSDGNGNSYFDRPAVKAAEPAQRGWVTGQAAGDATRHAPRWIEFSSGGGGG